MVLLFSSHLHYTINGMENEMFECVSLQENMRRGGMSMASYPDLSLGSTREYRNVLLSFIYNVISVKGVLNINEYQGCYKL